VATSVGAQGMPVSSTRSSRPPLTSTADNDAERGRAVLITTTGRPHPLRTRLETYPVTDRAGTRFADMDANGHVNNNAMSAVLVGSEGPTDISDRQRAAMQALALVESL
jgi:hypothetical protein